jgi:hypothetical protein
MAMWTTALIRIMAITGQCPNVVSGSSITSTATRRGMDEATQGTPATMQATSMRYRERGVVVRAAAEAGTKLRF